MAGPCRGEERRHLGLLLLETLHIDIAYAELILHLDQLFVDRLNLTVFIIQMLVGVIKLVGELADLFVLALLAFNMLRPIVVVFCLLLEELNFLAEL